MKDTMNITINYALNMDDNGNYVVETTTKEYAIPSSNFILDVEVFKSRVQSYANNFMIDTIINDINRYRDIAENDNKDKNERADALKRMEVLKAYRDTLSDKSEVSDRIALTFAYAIVSPNLKYSRLSDIDDLLKSIRSGYTDKSDKNLKSIVKMATAYANNYIVVSDNDKGVVYKNIHVKLSLKDTELLIDTVGAVNLKYTKKGIASKTMNDRRALNQYLLFILKDTFDLSVTSTKSDNAVSYRVY